MRICTVSLNSIWENKDENFRQCIKFIKAAKDFDCEIVIFPEMTLTGFTMNIDMVAESIFDSKSIKDFQAVAKQLRMNVIFGLVTRSHGKAGNSAVWIDENRMETYLYNKIHPFSIGAEDKYIEAGNEIRVVDYKNYKIGLTVCYDLRFPEVYTALGEVSHLIVNIASWPKARINHWNVLLSARAIENQVYVVGVNRTGVDANQLEYVESSKVFDPCGNEVIPCYEDFEFKIFDIDLNESIIQKKKFPLSKDRRNKLYNKFLWNQPNDN